MKAIEKEREAIRYAALRFQASSLRAIETTGQKKLGLSYSDIVNLSCKTNVPLNNPDGSLVFLTGYDNI